MKLPLAVPIDSRNGNGQYDARPVNVLKESSAASESVVKRPALVKSVGPDVPANGNGLVDFNGSLISVFGASLGNLKRSYGSYGEVFSNKYGTNGLHKWAVGFDKIDNSVLAVPNLSYLDDLTPAVVFYDDGTVEEIGNPWQTVSSIDGASLPQDSDRYGAVIRTSGRWHFTLMCVSLSGDKVMGLTSYEDGAWGSMSEVTSFGGDHIVRLSASADSSDNIYLTIMGYVSPSGQSISVHKSTDLGSTWVESVVV